MARYLSVRTLLLQCAGLLLVGQIGRAAPLTFDITVDTSTIAGALGSVDFNFDPGPLISPQAFLRISNFSSEGQFSGVCPCGIGDVSGQLPGDLVFDNTSGFNDYFDVFGFASAMSFKVTLSGPAVDSPDGVSTSGSTFAFSLFSDPAGTVPVLTNNNTGGFALLIDLNLNGSTTITDFSAQTTVMQESSPVPEPASGILTVTIAAFLILLVKAKCYRSRVNPFRRM